LATVLAYVLMPLVDRLQRWRVPQGVAIALCLLMVGLLGATLLVLLVPIVSELVPMVRTQLPDLLVKGFNSMHVD
jgi:predicted PurR-regulated permease PerM